MISWEVWYFIVRGNNTYVQTHSSCPLQSLKSRRGREMAGLEWTARGWRLSRYAHCTHQSDIYTHKTFTHSFSLWVLHTSLMTLSFVALSFNSSLTHTYRTRRRNGFPSLPSCVCVWHVSPASSAAPLRVPWHCRSAAPSSACAAARRGARGAPGPAGNAVTSELTEEPAGGEEDQKNDALVSPGPAHAHTHTRK